MNSNKNYFELIDAYLNGEMNGADAVDFETQLSQDPLLESELNVQREIVETIRKYRKSELKATLNAVEVSGGVSSFNITAGVLILLLLGGGIFYFTGSNSEDAEPVAKSSQLIKTQPEETDPSVSDQTVEISEEIKNEETPESINDNENIAGNIELNNEGDNPISSNVEISEKIAEVEVQEEMTKPEVNLPEVIEDFNDSAEQNQISENIRIPQNNLGKVSETILPKTEVVEIDKGKYNFHYQFVENKLYLYGEFDKKYEILELNTPRGISIYMFYQDSFYSLQQNQKKITPLKAIEDKSLIRDLKTIKEN